MSIPRVVNVKGAADFELPNFFETVNQPISTLSPQGVFRRLTGGCEIYQSDVIAEREVGYYHNIYCTHESIPTSIFMPLSLKSY